MDTKNYFPKADIEIQKFSTAFPGAAIRPLKFLPHSTEGNRWEPYDGGKSAPHLTMKIDPSKPRTSESRQHFPATMSSRALVNSAGGVETNRLEDGPFQVEVVCTSGWASPENTTAPYTVPLKATDLPDWFLRDIGEVWAWLHWEHGTPLIIAAEFKAWNAKRPTVTNEKWISAKGAIGHQHVPENDHTDPGDLDIARVLWHAQNFVLDWQQNGYPWATAEPAPEPPPIPEPEPPEVPPTPTPKPPPEPEPAPTPKDKVGETLRPGDVGKAVGEAQKRLTAHGFPHPRDGVPDNIFSSRMKLQTEAFQAREGLAKDGIIGKGTWTALLDQTYAEMEAEARTILTGAGWRVNTASRLLQGIKDFQGAYAFGSALAVDGKLGPLTMGALRHMKTQGNRLSPNFKATEFACKCGGKYSDCRRIWIARTMVLGAEKLRTIYGPWSPSTSGNSACRCPKHNASVGGYVSSQHLYGYALDIPARFSVTKIKSLNHFQALGKNASNGTVRHVDNRASGPNNSPRATGSTTSPYIYNYG